MTLLLFSPQIHLHFHVGLQLRIDDSFIEGKHPSFLSNELFLIDWTAIMTETKANGDGTSRSLPRENPCLSYWQRTTRGFPHLFANRDTPVPAKSKYVIIGSGISGGLVAFELIQAGVKGEEIVILEAREAASGASSRNAGHVRPGMLYLE